jgi:signal transduction histidine kinase
MRGILRIPDVTRVEVLKAGGQSLAVGELSDPSSGRSTAHSVELYHETGEKTYLGTLRVTASLARVDALLKSRIFLILGMNFAKTVIVSIFTLLLFERLVTRHLRNVAAFARALNLDRLDKPLTLTRRPQRKPADELDDVVQAVNAMLADLKVGKARHLQLEEQLRQQVLALQEADRQKDRILEMLAHELRNPLAPIRTGIELIYSEPNHYQLPQWLLSTLDRQSAHLQSIVDHLMLAVQSIYGKLPLSVQRVDLRSVVDEAIAESRERISAKRLQLQVAIDAGLFLWGDASLLRQAIVNLLDNAAKFTPAGGCVAVVAETCNEQIVLRVKDSGTGIEASRLRAVFEPFTQDEQPLARTAGGFGLGLAIVKGIVTQHSGTVEVASAGPGHGSEFILRFADNGMCHRDSAPSGLPLEEISR